MTRADSHKQTARWKNRTNVYHDKKGMRFVVYRRAGKVSKKTSVRYREQASEKAARRYAETLAKWLREWPAERLAEFWFKKISKHLGGGRARIHDQRD